MRDVKKKGCLVLVLFTVGKNNCAFSSLITFFQLQERRGHAKQGYYSTRCSIYVLPLLIFTLALLLSYLYFSAQTRNYTFFFTQPLISRLYRDSSDRHR